MNRKKKEQEKDFELFQPTLTKQAKREPDQPPFSGRQEFQGSTLSKPKRAERVSTKTRKQKKGTKRSTPSSRHTYLD